MPSSLYSADPYKQPWLLRGVLFEGGRDGQPCGEALQAHCDFCYNNGLLPVLPPWPILLDRTIFTNELVGVPGKSVVRTGASFTYLGYGNQFTFLNRNFSLAAGTESVFFRDFRFEMSPQVGGAVIGIAGVSGGEICNLNMTVARNIVSGRPVPCLALIDLYACVKRVQVYNNYLENATGAWGAGNPWSPDGGACVWIRNFTSNGANPLNVTEHNDVHHNTMVHMTSDEVVAFFGCFGAVRRNKLTHNNIIGLSSIGGQVHHIRWLTIFPLALGPHAAVYDNEISNNYIEDPNAVYEVIGIGNAGTDANYPCYNNKLRCNIVRHNRDSSIQTTWPLYGPTLPDPNAASIGIRCQEGVFGLAYFNDTSGNATENDCVFSGGPATLNTAFAGWQNLVNPTAAGNVFTGIANSRTVLGGSIEAFGRCFYNCKAVNSVYYRLNGPSSTWKVFTVDANDGDAYEFKNCKGVSLGGFVEVLSGVLTSSRITVINVTSVVQAGVLVQNNVAGVTVFMRGCSINGTFSGVTAGAGAATVRYDLNLLGSLDNYFGPNGLPITFRTPAGDLIVATEAGGQQQLGFFGKPPAPQGVVAMAGAAVGGGGGGAVTELTTFDGFTIGQAIRQLRLLGFLL